MYLPFKNKIVDVLYSRGHLISRNYEDLFIERFVREIFQVHTLPFYKNIMKMLFYVYQRSSKAICQSFIMLNIQSWGVGRINMGKKLVDANKLNIFCCEENQ